MDAIDYIAIALIIVIIACLLYFSYIENIQILYNLKYLQKQACADAGGVVKEISIANMTIYVCCNKDTKTWMGMYWDENGNIPILTEDLQKELDEKAVEVCKN